MLAAVLGLCLLADPPAESTPQRAARLVREFENPSFRKREAAARDLLLLGAAAKPALAEGLQSPNAEVRDRCRHLLPAILASDFKERLDAFEKDPYGKSTHELPGWERFKKAAGGDSAARAFYIGMMRRVPEAADLESDASKLAASVVGRTFEILLEREELQERREGRRRNAETDAVSFDGPEIAFLLFAAADEAVAAQIRKMPGDGVGAGTRLLYDAVFQNAVRDRKVGPIYNRLVLAWMRSHTDKSRDLEGLDSAFAYVRDTEVRGSLDPDTLDLALSWFDRADLPDDFSATLVTVIGKCGDRRHIPNLSRFLANTAEYTVIGNGKKLYRVQFRDIALAMTLHLQGLKPRHFGFEMMGKLETGFYPFQLGFAADTDRQKAFEQYSAWLRK